MRFANAYGLGALKRSLRRAFFNYDCFALVSLYLLIQAFFKIEGSNRNSNGTAGMFTHVSLTGLLLSIALLISISIVYIVDFHIIHITSIIIEPIVLLYM